MKITKIFIIYITYKVSKFVKFENSVGSWFMFDLEISLFLLLIY